MLSAGNTVVLSRVLVPLLDLVVWILFYLNALCAYRRAKGGQKIATQLGLVLGAVAIVVLQMNLMEHLTPGDAYGGYFFNFVMIECGGTLIVMFGTLFLERERSKRKGMEQ